PTLMLDTPQVPDPFWMRPAEIGIALRRAGAFIHDGSPAYPSVPGFEPPLITADARNRVVSLLAARLPAACFAITRRRDQIPAQIAALLHQIHRRRR
ncbi:MAG: hypothetical protein ACRDQ0_06200, partial [Pseudonocardia sp.]